MHCSVTNYKLYSWIRHIKLNIYLYCRSLHLFLLKDHPLFLHEQAKTRAAGNGGAGMLTKFNIFDRSVSPFTLSRRHERPFGPWSYLKNQEHKFVVLQYVLVIFLLFVQKWAYLMVERTWTMWCLTCSESTIPQDASHTTQTGWYYDFEFNIRSSLCIKRYNFYNFSGYQPLEVKKWRLLLQVGELGSLGLTGHPNL